MMREINRAIKRQNTMILRKDYIDLPTAQKYFPSLVRCGTTSKDEQCKFFIEVSASTKYKRKTYSTARITAALETTIDSRTIRSEVFTAGHIINLNCEFAKPLRAGDRETIYWQAKEHLLIKAYSALREDHPYIKTLTAM